MNAQTVVDSGESESTKRPELNSHLARESFVALASHSNRVLITDRTLKRREMKSGLLLALAAGLFAAAPYSPLEWAQLIALREYR